MPLQPQLKELLLQSLEHEGGGMLVYRAALECVVHDELREEWREYLEHAQGNVELLSNACTELGVDPGEMTSGRRIVLETGKVFLAMSTALAVSDPAGAELLACECVVFAETKRQFNWELIGKCVRALSGVQQAALGAVYDLVGGGEDYHLCRAKAWRRELWMKSLGLDAVLPPPEDERGGKTAMEAALNQAAAQALSPRARRPHYRTTM